VWIKSIDAAKGRFSLTMKPPPSAEEMQAFTAKEAEREEQFKASSTWGEIDARNPNLRLVYS